ncbi:MAG: enoyl-CoA hydratase/isomerase family protein [Arenicellales bacterium]|nr:enoyl-CoA hydratase/isomerase family protein [Arenicellales bacterium]
MSKHVRFERDGAIAKLTLTREEKLNALSDDMLDTMREHLEGLAETPEVRALIVSAEGRAFSAGGDITSMERMDAAAFNATIHRYMRLSRTFRDLDIIAIAAIHGYALAGGFELALMCDIRIAASSAQFGLPDAALGLSPTSGMTWMLPRVIGLGRAMHLTLTGDRFDAAEAMRIGFVTTVVDDEDLYDHVSELAQRIAGYPGPVVARTKALFLDALECDFSTAMREEEMAERDCFRSGETQRAFRTFLDRKK